MWRSFTGPIIAYPLFILLLLTGPMTHAEGLSVEGYLLRESAIFAIGMFLFLRVMLFGCVLLDREDQWGRYISIYNWSAPIQLGLLLTVRVLQAGNVLPGPMAAFATIVVFGVTLYMLYKIASTTLEIDIFQAVAVVMVDICLGLGLNLL